MAASNWDTLALDEKSEPSTGYFTSPLGVRVEVYKNWLYIYDAKAWEEGGAFTQDCVMEVQFGAVSYKDVSIFALRGPQEGVYAFVESWHKEGGTYICTGMLGIGVYGFEDSTWVGVKPSSIEWLKKKMAEDEIAERIPNVLSKIDFTKAVRFNQGDAFFADRGMVTLAPTKPGEATVPILMQALKETS